MNSRTGLTFVLFSIMSSLACKHSPAVPQLSILNQGQLIKTASAQYQHRKINNYVYVFDMPFQECLRALENDPIVQHHYGVKNFTPSTLGLAVFGEKDEQTGQKLTYGKLTCDFMLGGGKYPLSKGVNVNDSGDRSRSWLSITTYE